jgi:hypothetical protein
MHDSDQSRFVSHERFVSTVPRANTLIRKETMICVGPVSLERVRRRMLKLDQTGTESIPIGEMEIVCGAHRSNPDFAQIAAGLFWDAQVRETCGVLTSILG